MTTVDSSATIADGLRTEFVTTYQRQQRDMENRAIADLMDLNVNATNRSHTFAYFNSAPHMEYWRRGDTVPKDIMDSVSFTAEAHTWARRIAWHKEDRKDDQLKALVPQARMAGTSAAMLPDRFAFDALNGATATLPSVPNAPDGVALFSATDGGGGARFGVSGGNIVSGGASLWNSTSDTQAGVYEAMERFKGMQDGKGQPLWSNDVLDQGFTIIYPHSRTQEMDEAFAQRRQADSNGSSRSNVFHDSSRDFRLWGSQRLTTDHIVVVLRGSPVKPLFLFDREGLRESQALEEDNNSDHVRDTGEEYVQFERRAGLGVALPYAVVEVQDS